MTLYHFSCKYCFRTSSSSLFLMPLWIFFSGRDGWAFWHGQCPQKPSTLYASIFIYVPVVEKLSTLHCGLTRWKYDMTIFSKLLVLFRRGLNLPDSDSSSRFVYRPVGIAWHKERIKLTSINSDKTFAQDCRFLIKSLVHNGLPCKNYGWSTNHNFTYFAQ